MRSEFINLEKGEKRIASEKTREEREGSELRRPLRGKKAPTSLLKNPSRQK